MKKKDYIAKKTPTRRSTRENERSKKSISAPPCAKIINFFEKKAKGVKG